MPQRQINNRLNISVNEASDTYGLSPPWEKRSGWLSFGLGVGKEFSRIASAKLKKRCRVTGVENPVHLVASHCKPWRDSNNNERLDGENGLLLTPSIDHLFDRGFIGFENNGQLILSPVAHRPSLQRMGIDTTKILNVGAFTSGQKHFLEFHRNAVLLQSNRP
jgi:putative restriction endonuclease